MVELIEDGNDDENNSTEADVTITEESSTDISFKGETVDLGDLSIRKDDLLIILLALHWVHMVVIND